jgi:hypothetical protein
VEEPLKHLRRRAKDYAPGDTDLAWTRTTPWRSLLASAFDGGTPTVTSTEVQAERGNASAALISGWLQARLGARGRVTASDGPGVTAVEVRFEGDERLRIDRPDGRLATMSRTGRPDRALPLKRRELGDLIAEELRRLDSDQPYAEALARVTGEQGLNERPPMRTHVWRDPVTGATRKKSPPKQTQPTRDAAKKDPVTMDRAGKGAKAVATKADKTVATTAAKKAAPKTVTKTATKTATKSAAKSATKTATKSVRKAAPNSAKKTAAKSGRQASKAGAR